MRAQALREDVIWKRALLPADTAEEYFRLLSLSILAHAGPEDLLLKISNRAAAIVHLYQGEQVRIECSKIAWA